LLIVANTGERSSKIALEVRSAQEPEILGPESLEVGEAV